MKLEESNFFPRAIKTSWRRRYDISLYVPVTSQVTLNDVTMQRGQVVAVVRLYKVLLERRNNVSWAHNNDVPSVRFHNVSNKSQMKYPTTSQWYVSTTSH